MIAPQTGIPVIDWFLAALDAWGYLIVFGFTVLENLFVVGSLTPGETIVIAAALVASRGGLYIAGVWAASFIGTVTGANISYQLGKRAGLEGVRAFVERLAGTWVGKVFRIDASGLDEIQKHFDDHGSKTVLISRFAIGAKNFVPAMAGASNMKIFWFEFYTAVGAIIYTTAMCLIGWFLGTNIDLALRVASGIGYAGLAVLALFMVVLWVAQNRIRSIARRHDDPEPDDSGDGDAR
jgi:membrane protein DedA with SNARE-associated domain